MMLPVPVNGKLPFVSEKRRVRTTSTGSGSSKAGGHRASPKHSAPLEPPPLNSASVHYYTARSLIPTPRSAPIPIRPNRLAATAPARISARSSNGHSSASGATRKNSGSAKDKSRRSSLEEQKQRAAGASPNATPTSSGQSRSPNTFLSEPTLQHATGSSPSKQRSGNQLFKFLSNLFGRRRREVELHSPAGALGDEAQPSPGSSPNNTIERSKKSSSASTSSRSPKSSLNSVRANPNASTSTSSNTSSTTASSSSTSASAKSVRRTRSFTETDHSADRFWASPSDPIVVHKREPVMLKPKAKSSPKDEERGSGAVTLLIRAEHLGAIQALNPMDPEIPLDLLSDPIYVLDENDQVEYLVCSGRRRYFSTSPTKLERLVPIAEEDESESDASSERDAEAEAEPEQVTRETSFSEAATELDADMELLLNPNAGNEAAAPSASALSSSPAPSSTGTSETSGTGTGANSPARAESPAPEPATAAAAE